MTATRSTTLDRAMPHDLVAERALLGGLLTDGTTWLLVCDIVRAEDFYSPHHGALWLELSRLAAAGVAIDIVTVGAEVSANADRFGGAGYVAGLPEHCVATTNLRHYADVVRENAIRRRLVTVALELQRAAVGEAVADLPLSNDIDEIVQAGAARVAQLSAPLERNTWSIVEAFELTEQERVDALERGHAAALTTGFPDLDRVLDGGIRPGELVVVGGSTSMGKSALALSMAYGVAEQGARVGYASVEPKRQEWTHRSLAFLSGVPISALRGERQPGFAATIEGWRTMLPEFRVDLYYRPGARFREVATQARRWKLTGGLDVLVVDYLQLMRHERRGERHDLAVGETVGDFKRLAGELNVAVVLLSQVTRSSTRERIQAAPGIQVGWQEWWKEALIPRVQDLKESGSIENDADVVLFPVRADRAGPDSRALEGAPHGAALIAIAKQRNGPTGIVAARWDGPCACYRPWSGAPRRLEADDDQGRTLDDLDTEWHR